MGTGDSDISDEINDILTLIPTNINANKNAGCAVLYEWVRTVMSIESS